MWSYLIEEWGGGGGAVYFAVPAPLGASDNLESLVDVLVRWLLIYQLV